MKVVILIKDVEAIIWEEYRGFTRSLAWESVELDYYKDKLLQRIHSYAYTRLGGKQVIAVQMVLDMIDEVFDECHGLTVLEPFCRELKVCIEALAKGVYHNEG